MYWSWAYSSTSLLSCDEAKVPRKIIEKKNVFNPYLMKFKKIFNSKISFNISRSVPKF